MSKITKRKFLNAIITTLILFGISVIAFFLSKRITILDPYSVWVSRSFFVINVFIASFFVYSVIAFMIRKWLRVRKRYDKTPEIFNKLIAVFIYSVAILMILGHYDVKITPFIATLGIGGLAIGLALQGTLTNLFSGIQIISDKEINVGDFVEFEGNSGWIRDISWRTTKIETLTSNYLVVPNSRFSDSYVMNNSRPSSTTGIVVSCGVSYREDLEEVEKITLEVAEDIQKNADGTVKNYEPKLRFREFGESNIKFRVILGVEDPRHQYSVMHEFIKALKKRYDEEGIEISWPVRKVYQYKSK